jgi:hypothetical protein
MTSRFDWERALIASPIRAQLKCVGLVIATHANPDGVMWPSGQTLASETSLTVRSARRLRAELVELGWFKRQGGPTSAKVTFGVPRASESRASKARDSRVQSARPSRVQSAHNHYKEHSIEHSAEQKIEEVIARLRAATFPSEHKTAELLGKEGAERARLRRCVETHLTAPTDMLAGYALHQPTPYLAQYRTPT